MKKSAKTFEEYASCLPGEISRYAVAWGRMAGNVIAAPLLYGSILKRYDYFILLLCTGGKSPQALIEGIYAVADENAEYLSLERVQCDGQCRGYSIDGVIMPESGIGLESIGRLLSRYSKNSLITNRPKTEILGGLPVYRETQVSKQPYIVLNVDDRLFESFEDKTVPELIRRIACLRRETLPSLPPVRILPVNGGKNGECSIEIDGTICIRVPVDAVTDEKTMLDLLMKTLQSAFMKNQSSPDSRPERDS